MSFHWDPEDALAEDLTGVFDMTGVGDGDLFVWDATAARFVPSDPIPSELLVKDGTTPPEPLTLEDGTDYLYKDS